MKFRVCHISTMTRWGGVERTLVDLLTDCSETTISHFLLTTSSIPELLCPIDEAGITRFEPKRTWRYDFGAIHQMASWLKQQKIQVVHSYNAYANTWGYLLSRLAQIPVFIAGERGTIWQVQPPVRWLDRLAQRQATFVVANSQASASAIQYFYQIPPKKIQVVFNAIPPLPTANVQQIRTYWGFNDKFIVGSVGRLDTPKQFGILIETAHLLHDQYPDIRFVLVGGGPMEKYLRQMISNYGLSDYFLITGWRSDARELLQAFDLYVSTSVQESFGNTLVEAALAGKAVIAPLVGGIPEIVLHQQTGLLLLPTIAAEDPQVKKQYKLVWINGRFSPPHTLNPQELAEAILFLYSHPELRRAYGMTGKARAERLFTLYNYRNTLETLYTQALAYNGKKTCS